jgi:hypothetical protein
MSESLHSQEYDGCSVRTLQLTDLPCTLLQEIYGWAPNLVCTHTAVCKWFKEILPESKAVELRVLKRRGVDVEYVKRFSNSAQRIHLTIHDHNPSFDNCVMRTVLSTFSPSVGNILSLDLAGALFVRCSCGVEPEKQEELDRARERVVFYITAIVKYATRLESLSIRDNGLSDQLCMMLAAGLSEHTGLKSLDLSNNRRETCSLNQFD